jgi:signal transduction histidine kinase
VWWNHAYENIRRDQVAYGQLLSDICVYPDSAIAHLIVAWEQGQSFQTISITPVMNRRYKGIDALVDEDIWCRWQHIGDAVITISPDLSAYRELQTLQSNHQSMLAIAGKKRAMAVERERIARSLHDTVIQNLYATSLSLSMSLRKASHDDARAITSAIDSIADVIAEIRNEIFDIESKRSSPVRLQLEDALMPVLVPVNADLVLTIDIPEPPIDIVRHLKAVCTEAASNAVRHGHATTVSIDISCDSQLLVVVVHDNGQGIAPDAVLHNGLNNMRERAELLGGKMTMTSSDREGTTVKWTVPCSGWCS